jgi:hypothetical protein
MDPAPVATAAWLSGDPFGLSEAAGTILITSATVSGPRDRST